MGIDEDAFQQGYKEGHMMGELEAYLEFTKNIAKMGITQNYEEIFKMLGFPESTSSRLMEYLPIHNEKWELPDNEHWEVRKAELFEKLRSYSDQIFAQNKK